MASWSDTSIYFYGDEEKMKEVEREIVKYIDGGYLCGRRHDGCSNHDEDNEGFGCMEVTILENYGDNICLAGMGRWCGPHGWFRCIAEQFGISGEYHDRIDCDGVYDRIIAKKGVIVESKSYDIISPEAFAEFGYDSMLSDIALAAEGYVCRPEEFGPHLEKFASIANIPVSKIFTDLGLDVPIDIQRGENNDAS